jgi:hypothetical protein
MSLISQIDRMERLLDVYGEGKNQCPHSLRFLGQVLPCPDGGCLDGCRLAKQILLEYAGLMESRAWRKS